MKKIIVFIFAMVIVACGGQSAPSKLSELPKTQASNLVDQYHIGIDDRVTVNVWKNPDLTVTVPVRPDGKISVPLVGEVTAGGRTPLQVADDITKRLSKYIRDPQVSVILEELRSHEFLSRVRVTGAVRNPLSISFRQGMTVLDVILEAGGVNEFASANRTKLYRRNGDDITTFDIQLSDILHNGDMASNIPVAPGDIISVPERIF